MIQVLTVDEIKDQVEHGALCYKELEFDEEFDKEHFCLVWKSFYESNMGVILADVEGDTYKGFIGGLVYIDPFDRHIKCQELVWYIKPPYRSLELANNLRLSFEAWGRDHGATKLRLSAPSAKTPLGYLLSRNGYRQLETVFEKAL